MKGYLIPEVDALRAESGKSYLEFLRSAALSAGLYVLRAGERDLQQPHSEDEVYYVIEGRARFKAGDDDYAVGAGSVLFVEAGAGHRFHSVEQDLKVLVFFAPPEGAGADEVQGTRLSR